MVQSNMGLSPVIYEEVTNDPRLSVVNKKILVNGEFVDRQFIRVPVAKVDKLARGTSAIEQWCYEKYGSPVYLGKWCKVAGYIIMDEMVYTHWKLCE